MKLKNPLKARDKRVTWDLVKFGSYPQTEVICETDTARCSNMENGLKCPMEKFMMVPVSEWEAIISASYNENGDAVVNNVRYRRIKWEDTTPAKHSGPEYKKRIDEMEYEWPDQTSYHYFMYEPIRWRILSVDEDDLFLLSNIGLENQKYHEIETPVTWETSTVRSFLNGYDASSNQENIDYKDSNFIHTAFTAAEQTYIRQTQVKNSFNSHTGIEGGNDTKDFVFLLSVDETLTEAYGFDIDTQEEDSARYLKTSTYAKAMGVITTYDNERSEYTGNAWWWLRSPGYLNVQGACVSSYGEVLGSDVHYYMYALRPALHLKLPAAMKYISYAGTCTAMRK